MTAVQPTVGRIPSSVRSRINSLAHQLAALQAIQLRKVLMGQIQAAVDEGASFDELNELVDKLAKRGAPG